MPKIFLPAIFFCISAVYADAQLKCLNPRPAGFESNKVVFSDRSNGFIFNNAGNLIRTTDQGATWKLVNRFSNMSHFDLFDSTGIIAGYKNTIYLSTDNGTTWKETWTGFTGDVTGIDIVSRDTIIMRSYYHIYKSFNRGLSWQTIALAGSQTLCFDFINSKLGFVGKSPDTILKTINGGEEWEELTAPTTAVQIAAISFLNKDTGYVFRSFSSLLKTTNSGASWTETNINDRILTIDFPTDSIGYIAGELGSMYQTKDAGAHWTWVTGGVDQTDINSLYFLTADTGFAVGKRGRILKTVDGGTSWQPYSLFYTDINGFAFPDAATGYAASGKKLYKTTDSSKTWTELALSPTGGMNSVFEKVQFFSRDTGFVTSSDPARVYKTNDGGQTWHNIHPSGNYAYSGTTHLSFVNDSTGFMSLNDYSYLLVKTKNRGSSWESVYDPDYADQFFTTIHFLDEKTGYALRKGQLHKTIDSAKTWALVYDNGFSNLNCVWFVNEKTGLINDGDLFRRTTDSGHTWVNIPLPYVDREVIAIKFLDKRIGYASCLSGSIYQSSDSGATWTLYSKAPNVCRLITFNKDSVIYFSRSYGTIVSASTRYVIYPEYKCPGGTFAYKSDVAGTTYAWQIEATNGTGFVPLTDDLFYSGANTNTITIKNAPGSWRGFRYRCLVNGNIYSRVYEIKYQSRWTGAADNRWENQFNWSCGAIPFTDTDVVIGAGSVILHSTGLVRSLEILPGHLLQLIRGKSLS